MMMMTMITSTTMSASNIEGIGSGVRVDYRMEAFKLKIALDSRIFRLERQEHQC